MDLQATKQTSQKRERLTLGKNIIQPSTCIGKDRTGHKTVNLPSAYPFSFDV